MKILLIRPPSILGMVGEHALQHPIGLCWLAASLREAGFEPEIVDYEVEPWSEGGFAKLVADKQPAMIALTAMTPLVAGAGAMAASARRSAPNAKIIVGGAHASILPVETLREYPAFDVASTGEGERKIVALAENLRDGRWGEAPPGTAVRSGDDINDRSAEKDTPIDLDALPFPARDLLRLPLYTGAPTPGFPQDVFHATVLFTSRGCPGRCIFCCAGSVFGPKVRFRSVENVVAEMTDCRDRFGFQHFTIDDDTFTLDRERAMRFCSAVEKLGVTWDCDTRVDHVDEELLRAMYAGGCRKVAFGVESGSPEILKKIRKGITHDQVRAAFRDARRAGLITCGFFMVGAHPDETAADIQMTRRFISEVDPDLISVAIASPYPKTELESALRSAGLLPDVTWEAYGQSFLGRPFTRTKTLGPEDLLKAQRSLLRGHYLRPAYILRRLMRLRSVSEAKYWFGAGFQFLRYIRRRSRSTPLFTQPPEDS